jgi:peptidoglycan/LPS O-acetylase OafA/YrhL
MSFFIVYIAIVTKPRYFPILDSLRLLASVCVFLAHSVVFFKLPGVDLSSGRFIEDAGYFGVIFFYTLSGFLITYLLLKEKENTGTIAIKDFYVRRALRIWPLYYFIVLLSFFVFPNLIPGHPAGGIGHWKIPFLLYLLFLPNIVLFGGFYLATCFHTYTIGFEEQFYLFWPLLLRKAERRLWYVLVALFVVPLVLDLLRVGIVGDGTVAAGMAGGVSGTAGKSAGTALGLAGDVLTFISLSNLPAFVAGAAAAVVYRGNRAALPALIGRRICGYVLGGAVLGLMYFTEPGGPGYVNVLSVIFAALILHLVQSETRWGRIGSLLAMGGRISYGIYIYHVAVLVFVSFCMAKVPVGWLGSAFLAYVVYLVVSFVLLWVTAALSYRYFEQFFLRKKRRFEPGGRVAAEPA